MKMLRSLASSLLGHLEASKGTRMFRVVDVHQDPQEGYRVITSGAPEFRIYCREIQYKVSYQKWWAPSRRINMYRVYCICGPDTPEILKQRLGEDFVVSRVLHRWASRASQKKAAIDSYIHLVVNKLKEV